jgi:2-oxoglutarate dehydrogenase E2 component (dihydrolipoamide succinyltransferase)
MTSVQVPSLGESVTQATLLTWRKSEGDSVRTDEPICELETDKANADLPAPTAGILHRLKKEGDVVRVGDVIAQIEEVGDAPAVPPGERGGKRSEKVEPQELKSQVSNLKSEISNLKSAIPASPHPALSPEYRGEGDEGKKGREAPPAAAEPPPAPPPSLPPTPQQTAPSRPPQSAASSPSAIAFDAHGVARVPMSNIRRRIAERLVEAQHTAAILTTFNEVDLTEMIDLRTKYKDRFQEVHGVSLGFMSFFARAVVLAIREVPQVNASIDGQDIVYHRYVNLGLAVSTDRGLTMPVLRSVQDMSFARTESEIKRLATAARDGKLSIEELSGGTFSITNGGVFGSLLSTPILTPPQSAILGMHNIQKRPMVIDDKIEIRSMMYVALSYDHRLVDGKEAITFLVRVKQMLEAPARLMLEI